MELLAPMKKQKLKKELGLFDVYAIATGVTLSAGFFLLPGLAAVEVGSGIPLAYLLAGLLITPGLVSMAELATAMPRAGGVYYFLDRSMGPLMGTVGGFGIWVALSLKAAFALIGIGAYLGLLFPEVNIGPISAGFAITFGIVNILGAKKSTTFQSVMVVGLLTLLAWFTGVGLTDIEPANLSGMFGPDPRLLVSTAGLVVVSYMGLTQVASVAEEVRNPERNIPLGMFLAFGTAVLVYTVGTAVMVGVVSADVLAQDGGDLTPVATVANVLVGSWGRNLMTAAAVLAFASVANAGILAASRYPLAMSRDNVLPNFFSKIQARGAPIHAIYATVGLILVFVLVFDASRVAKLAGAFQLMMFGLSCLAVMVMRESRIESYDPRFRSPFYPWLHILGVLAPFWLIVQMGILPSLFTGGIIVFGAVWYTYYARDRVDREGAIYHVFERLGRQRDEGLDRELRQIMKEKGLRDADPFEEVVTAASIIDTPGGTGFRNVIWEASAHLSEACDVSAKELAEDFLQGTLVGMTPVSHGVALPTPTPTRHRIRKNGARPLSRRNGDGCRPRRRPGRSIRAGAGRIFSDEPAGRSRPTPTAPGPNRGAGRQGRLHGGLALGLQSSGAQGGHTAGRPAAGADPRARHTLGVPHRTGAQGYPLAGGHPDRPGSPRARGGDPKGSYRTRTR